MKNILKLFAFISVLSATLLGGCGQKKEENPTPVVNPNSPLRMNVVENLGVPGVSTGYKAITFTFQSGYQVKFTLVGDPNFGGYTSLNVTLPGGVTPDGGDNGGEDGGDDDDDSGGGNACVSSVLALETSWNLISNTFQEDTALYSVNCATINSFMSSLSAVVQQCGNSSVSSLNAEIQAAKSEYGCN